MRLPLLQFVAEQYPDIQLDKTVVIAGQHLLGTTFDFFKELFAKGLQPANTFVIGKCYSTSLEVQQWFGEAGVRISPLSAAFDSHRSFDEQYESYVETFLQEVVQGLNFEEFERIIVLDDGGYLITAVQKNLKPYHYKVCAIEQTSAGFNKLKNQVVGFPIINIARSRAKLTGESPFIAEVAVNKLHTALQRYAVNNPSVLIVGMGSIGLAMRGLLSPHFTVRGCDTVTERCDFGGNYQEHLNDFDVIIGATGQSIIGLNEYTMLKPGALLVSVSSSDREFTGVEIRKLSAITNCHQDVEAGGVRLLNGGFPINFDGGVHSVAPEKIQLTHALLLAGAFEAMSKNIAPGLVDLGEGIQMKILERFNLGQIKR